MARPGHALLHRAAGQQDRPGPPAGARPHTARGRVRAVGIPAIALAGDDSSYERVIAELREGLHYWLAGFHDQALVIIWARQIFGRYHLITSLAHLHGEYATATACAGLEPAPGSPESA
jgi:hypothetical protein